MNRLLQSAMNVDRLLAALLAIAAFMTYTFIRAVDEVYEKSARLFDEAVLLGFRSHADKTQPGGPTWLPDVMRDFAALGSSAVLAAVALGSAILLALSGKRRTVVFILLAVLTGIIVEHVMKSGYGRPRHDLLPHGVLATSWSFPGGHSMNAAVVYLTLGNLLAQTQRRVSIKAFLISFSVFLSILIGVSNLYLGVRWPTDVFAGWTLGLSWAMVCWLVLHSLQRRGMLEPETS